MGRGGHNENQRKMPKNPLSPYSRSSPAGNKSSTPIKDTNTRRRRNTLDYTLQRVLDRSPGFEMRTTWVGQSAGDLTVLLFAYPFVVVHDLYL